MKVLSTNEFGYTYEVIKIDPVSNQPLPNERNRRLKVEVDTEKPEFNYFKTLRNELFVLEKIKKNYLKSDDLHLARFYDKGITNNKYKFVTTGCYGGTIGELMEKMPSGCFTKGTAIRVSLQMFKAINDLHRIGYVHANIAPNAFSIGLKREKTVVFLTDFDCSIKYRLKNGKHKKQFDCYPRGNEVRYMARTAHRNKLLSRRDDLESWFYVSMELFDKVALPWRDTKDPKKVLKKKEEFILDTSKIFLSLTPYL